jgi:hypothetical protein
MSEFGTLADKVAKIDIFRILEEITRENDVQNWIKNAPKDRIQKTGIDALGNKMQTDRSSSGEVYSDLTNILKEQNSGIAGITSHVTLTERGDFWDSLKLIIKRDGFETTANFIKEDGHMFKNFTQDYSNEKEYEDAVDGLSKDQLAQLVIVYYFPRTVKKINEILSR